MQPGYLVLVSQLLVCSSVVHVSLIDMHMCLPVRLCMHEQMEACLTTQHPSQWLGSRVGWQGVCVG